MADKKITQLTQVTELTGAELLPLAQGGVTKSASVDQLRGYKVYTALLTQSGGSNLVVLNSGTLTIGQTYWINEAEGVDFTNVGAPNNNQNTYFVATGTTPNSWGEGEGTGDVLLTDTGAPVVTVLENTIGNIWFEFISNGQYKINSNGLFNFNKRQFYYGLLKSVDAVNGMIVESDEAIYSDDYIQIVTSNNSNPPISVNGMTNLPIEIRVYN